MKICYLASADSIHSYRWAKYFAERGHQVEWISFSPLAFEPIKDVRFYILGSGRAVKRHPVEFLRGMFVVKRLIREIKPDVFHAHYVGVNGVIAALCGFHPLVLTAWGSDVLVAGHKLIAGIFVRMALMRADVITCDAEHMKETMVRMGVSRNRIKTIYFGTDTERFRRVKKDFTLAEQLGIQGSLVIISLRSLRPLYDVASLVMCIPDVLRAEPNAAFLIGGSGSEERRLRELAESSAVSRNIHFLGMIANEDLVKYLSLADIYVSTSLSDAGLSASTAEAMACELPVIVTDSGENRLWVRDRVNGFVVPCRDPRALSDKITLLLKNAEMRCVFGRASRMVIVERNTYKTEMEKMDNLYIELAKCKSEPLPPVNNKTQR